MKDINITKEELEKIYYINKEIIMWQRELDKLKCASLVKSPIISDMPRGGQPVGMEDYAINLAECEAMIAGLLARVQEQRKRIMEFINSMDDSLMKQIIFYRHISCMTWNEVARSIGGGNTEDSIKKVYQRYLKKAKVVPYVPSVCVIM